MSWFWMSCNLNHKVRFKLLPEGEKYLEMRHFLEAEQVPEPGDFLLPNVDAAGWSEMPLWEFMEAFGPEISSAGNKLIETEIQFQLVDQGPVAVAR